MPYRRKRRYKPKVSNLKKWRKKLRKPRGGANTRQTLANARAIKQLKRRPELKFQNTIVASSANNFVGTQLHWTKVNRWGLPNSTADWQAFPAATFLTPEKYCPVIMRPIACMQSKISGNPPNPWAANATLGDLGSGENQRVGNTVTMHSLHIRGVIVGGQQAVNTGNYAKFQALQKMTLVLVKDSSPNPNQVNLGTGVYDPGSVSCQLYPPTLDNFQSQALNKESQEALRSIANSQTPLTTSYYGPKYQSQLAADCEKLSYYSKDQVLTSGRFKILKKKVFTVQQTPNPALPNLPSAMRCQKTFSFTYKSRHKFHFANDKALTPSNQCLLLFMYSDTPSVRNVGGVAPLHGIDPPQIQLSCRFQFKDE